MGDPQRLRHGHDLLAYATVSDDDHVAGQALFGQRGWRAVPVEQAPQAGEAIQQACHRRNQAEHQGVQGDRYQCTSQDKRVVVGFQQAHGQSGLAQDERELADLASACGDHQHREGRV